MLEKTTNATIGSPDPNRLLSKQYSNSGKRGSGKDKEQNSNLRVVSMTIEIGDSQNYSFQVCGDPLHP